MNSEDGPVQTREEVQRQLELSKKKMSACVLDHSWPITIASVLVSVPLSVRYKTYTPFVFAAVSGTGLDYLRGFQKCKHFNKEIAAFKYTIAKMDNPDFVLPK